MSRKRAEKPPEPGSMDAPLRQRMTDERWREKAESYVAKMGVVQGLREDKAAENKRRQEEIDELFEEAEALRLELVEGLEATKQGDLFAPSKSEAQRGLAEVAKRAGDAASENGTPDGNEGAPEAPGNPLASEDAGDGDEVDPDVVLGTVRQ